MKNLIRRIADTLLARVYTKLNHISSRNAIYSELSICLSRASASIAVRVLDDTNPISWEFSGFSQNGEDGILDFLWSKLKSRNRYFVEIGASNGIRNNTAWFAHARRFNGLMIDGNAESVAIAEQCSPFGTQAHCLFVNEANVTKIMDLSTYSNPDIFSLDIDGTDYYLAKSILKIGLRPKVFIVEYNSAFGPDNSCTVEYDPAFDIAQAHPTHLYYGVSIRGWRTLFEKSGYRFITVDSNGVNAVFADTREFDPEFVGKVQGLEFAENVYQFNKFKAGWQKQAEMIRDRKTVAIR